MNTKTMERKKAKVMSTAAEDCGVWLDAAELRAKKQKKVTRPISKLLNPLARAGGYSMAVALNFTQTKMHMPATKQSTISSFFLPESKLSKDSCNSSHLSEISFTPSPELHGTKRKRTVTNEPHKVACHTSQLYPGEFGANLEEDSDEICIDQKKEQDFFHLIWGYQSKEPEPAEKRFSEDVCTKTGTETQEVGNGSIIHRYGTVAEMQDIPETVPHLAELQQDFHENFRANKTGSHYYTNQENLRTHDVMDKDISIKKPVLSARSTTHNTHIEKPLSQQRHHSKCSPVKKNDKDNIGLPSPRCKTKVSPHKHILSRSPSKRFAVFQKPVFQKLKQYHSPKKSVSESLDNEQDSFAKLFTQDSEGFRVIANHNEHKRCPLTDQTNLTKNGDNWDLLSVQSLEREEEDLDLESDMLFTQDSQGNMVIKH